MLEKVKQIELFEDYHFEAAAIEDGRLKITASTSQRERIAEEFTGEGIDDKLKSILEEGSSFLSDAFNDIKEGIEQADTDHPLDDYPSLDPDEPDDPVEVDVDKELETIKGEVSPDLTFDEEAAGFVIDAFGWDVDKNGMIVHADTGEFVETFNGHIIPLASMAAIVEDENGDAVPLRDNFADMVEWVSSKK